MPEWVDHQTDPEKRNNLRRREVVAAAKKACEEQGNVFGILVKRDITSEDQIHPLRLVAGPHPSVPAYHIMDEERFDNTHPWED